jgi:urease gamma subunit
VLLEGGVQAALFSRRDKISIGMHPWRKRADPVKLPDLDAVVLLSPDQLQQVVDEKTGHSVSQIQKATLGVDEARGGITRLVAGLCIEVFGYVVCC